VKEASELYSQLGLSPSLHDLTPSKSVKLFRVLFQCQLPYEMRHVMHMTLQEASREVAAHLDKNTSEIDADTLLPYLSLVLVRGFEEGQDLRCVLLQVEYFTVHKFSGAGEEYSVTSFVEVENRLQEQHWRQ